MEQSRSTLFKIRENQSLQHDLVNELRAVSTSISLLTQATQRMHRSARVAHPPVSKPGEEMVEKIRTLRRKRGALFNGELFGEPAWDMLLQLYSSMLANKRETVTGLCYASGVPSTTALRWLRMLETDEWIVRQPDPQDRRRAYLLLSVKAETAMERLFAQPEFAEGL